MNTLALKAAVAYFVPVFTWAFLVGIFRVLVLVPRLGELTAVLLELPVVTGAAWFICRRVVRHFGVPAAAGPRLAMGGAAFALLMVVEYTLAVTAFGRTPGAFFASLTTPAGMLGLAGQVLFGLLPWWQARGGR